MLKQVYEINELGYLKEIYVKEFDTQGNCIEELAENIITTNIPQGLYRAKWTGSQWLEDMTKEEIDELNKPAKEQEITNLKNQLEETDYQIIKSSEYQLLGLEIPYNLEELHTERQVLRDKINELENTY